MGRHVVIHLVCDLCSQSIGERDAASTYDLVPSQRSRQRGHRLYLHRDCHRALVDGAVPLDDFGRPVSAPGEQPASPARNGQRRRPVAHGEARLTQMKIVARALLNTGGKVVHAEGHTWRLLRDVMTEGEIAQLPSGYHMGRLGRAMQERGYLEMQIQSARPVMLALTPKGRDFADGSGRPAPAADESAVTE